jgi:Ca-activated chloride channel family protein
MNWLALSPLQVAALWSAAAALALWLYLHNRRPQRRRVSTLRFWASVQPSSQPRRRRLREPWALLAQVLFLLFLILALANPRLGNLFEGRSVVIVMDTSIWSQVRPAGETPWIDRTREAALRVLNTLPASDRVLLLPAESDAPPIVPFTTDRAVLRRAIAETRVSSGVADIPRALEMGKAALAGSRRGLLVYAGPGMLGDQQAQKLEEFREALAGPGSGVGQLQFLVRLVGGPAPVQNRGITRLSLRRDAAQPDRWHVLTQVKNYSDSKTSVVLKLSINGQPLGQRTVALAPGELANSGEQFLWDQGGVLEAEISPPDDLEADNHATVNIPAFRPVRAALFTGSSPLANDLLSVLSTNPYLQTEVVQPGMNLDDTPDIAIYEGKNVPDVPVFNSIWFLSGPGGTPARSVRVTNWNARHPVTRWVRSHDVSVRNPAPLEVRPTDTVLAYGEGTPPMPLILAREQNGRRLLIIGFNPHNSNFPLQSAFPLLMAAGVEWMTESVADSADSLSVGELDLPGPVARIVAPSGKEVAFARKGTDVHLIATETGTYRLMGPNGETDIAVNTPLLPAQRLKPSATEAGLIQSEPLREAGRELWRWLLVPAMILLWLEWWLFYSTRRKRQLAESLAVGPQGDNRILQGPSLDTGRSRERSEARDAKFVA